MNWYWIIKINLNLKINLFFLNLALLIYLSLSYMLTCYLKHSTVCRADVTVIKTQAVWSNCCWLWEDRALGSLMVLQPRCQACLIMPSFHSCLMTDTARTNRRGRDERAGTETRKEERSLSENSRRDTKSITIAHLTWPLPGEISP